MERRISNRKLTETKVYLHHPDLPAAPCITRDLSSNGVFVETADAGRLKERAVMQMTFAVDLGNLTRLYDFRVTVVRVTTDGLALAIDRSRPAKSRAVPKRVDEKQTAKVLPLRR